MLYVITVLLAAQTVSWSGLIVISCACAILSLLSYAATHADDADFNRRFGWSSPLQHLPSRPCCF